MLLFRLFQTLLNPLAGKPPCLTSLKEKQMKELGKFLATGIGSMPFTSPEQAVDLALSKIPEAPHWPQLPKLGFSEQMEIQYSEGLPCAVVDRVKNRMHLDTSGDYSEAFGDFYAKYEQAVTGGGVDPTLGISPDYSHGFHAMEQRLKADGVKRPFVKCQTVGPLTLTLTITDQDKRALYYNDEFKDLCVKLVVMKCLWQIERLKPYAEKVICFVDEPILTAFGSSTYISVKRDDVVAMIGEVVEAIKAAGAIPGIHCCGNTEWSIPMDAGVEVLNFDAFTCGDSLVMYSDAVKAYLNRGGFLAWGIVPTSGAIHDHTPETLAAKLEGYFQGLAAKGIEKALIAEKAILSPSCGTGTLSSSEAELVYDTLSQLSKRMKQKYGF
jgi:hypothetical protein